MLHKDTISIPDEDGNWCSFSAQATYGLLKYVVFRSVVCVQFCPNLSIDFCLDFFENSGGSLTRCKIAEYRNRSCSDDVFLNQAVNVPFLQILLLLGSTKQFFSH